MSVTAERVGTVVRGAKPRELVVEARKPVGRPEGYRTLTEAEAAAEAIVRAPKGQGVLIQSRADNHFVLREARFLRRWPLGIETPARNVPGNRVDPAQLPPDTFGLAVKSVEHSNYTWVPLSKNPAWNESHFLVSDVVVPKRPGVGNRELNLVAVLEVALSDGSLIGDTGPIWRCFAERLEGVRTTEEVRRISALVLDTLKAQLGEVPQSDTPYVFRKGQHLNVFGHLQNQIPDVRFPDAPASVWDRGLAYDTVAHEPDGKDAFYWDLAREVELRRDSLCAALELREAAQSLKAFAIEARNLTPEVRARLESYGEVFRKRANEYYDPSTNRPTRGGTFTRTRELELFKQDAEKMLAEARAAAGLPPT